MRRRDFLAGAAGLTLAGITGCGRSQPSSTRERKGRPNVIVVYADDMRLDELQYMPFASSLAERGTTFTNARQMTPVCSPARAGFLRGQYANGPNGHGVVAQSSRYGPLQDQMLPVWLAQAGVECGLVGKYLSPLAGRAQPGWTGWWSTVGPRSGDRKGYTIGLADGTKVQPDQDQTTYLADRCEDFIRTATSPWFVWFCPTDPHTPYTPSPRHDDALRNVYWPVPSADVTGAPDYVRSLPEPDVQALFGLQQHERLRLQELLDLDAGLVQVFDALEDTGQVDSTTVVFTSDNGNALFDHRLPLVQKGAPYDCCMRVPLVAVGPDFGSGDVVDAPVAAAQDLTATVLDLFDATAGVPQDGVPLLRAPQDRGLLGYCDPENGPAGMPPCDVLVTRDRKLIRYTEPAGVDHHEVYDLVADPDELVNVADGAEVARLAPDLDALLRGS